MVELTSKLEELEKKISERKKLKKKRLVKLAKKANAVKEKYETIKSSKNGDKSSDENYVKQKQEIELEEKLQDLDKF